MLDEKDKKILNLLQENCKVPVKFIAQQVNSPVTTIYTRIKQLENKGIIKGYKTVLEPKKLDLTVTAFILVSFNYKPEGSKKALSQREIAEEIAKFPEVQEVHIITGDWDMLVKVKAENVNTVGDFIIDKLRNIGGVEKTKTSVVFDTLKETQNIKLI